MILLIEKYSWSDNSFQLRALEIGLQPVDSMIPFNLNSLENLFKLLSHDSFSYLCTAIFPYLPAIITMLCIQNRYQ